MNAAWTAAKADVVVIDDGGAVDDGGIDVRVVNHRAIHIHNRRIVMKVVTAPLAARKTNAHVAEAVIHAAIVADVRPPVALMEDIMAVFPSPVVGGP